MPDRGRGTFLKPALGEVKVRGRELPLDLYIILRDELLRPPAETPRAQGTTHLGNARCHTRNEYTGSGSRSPGLNPEGKRAGVFQKAAHQRDHPDVPADPVEARPEAADAPDDEVFPHPGLRRLVERLDDQGVSDRVHLA